MTRNDFRQLFERKIVILDGATGTELAKRGMPRGVSPEQWILENPAAIIAVQQAYRDAGSDLVYVPSFGGNRVKLGEFGLADRTSEINTSLARLSRQAVGDKTLVFGDLAPTGQFVFPFGDVPFEDAVNIYKEQVTALLAGGVDGFAIETMMDLQEARAALLAVKESCDLPVIVSMTFEKNGRSLTGNDPLSALVTLQAMGADAFGCNCSTGPADMLKVIGMLKPYATIPLLAKPNAGMPRLIDGKTVFSMDAAEFGGFVAALAAAGANLLGGCCGTTPEHISAQASAAAGIRPQPPCRAALSAVCSSRKTRLLDFAQPFAVIGERINPTGKKALQAELREGSLKAVRTMADDQSRCGAALLDVNMGLSGIDEKAMMLKTLAMLAPTVDTPLCLDSTSAEVMEAALRLYPGRALVNSVSAEKIRLEKMLPVAAKYGAMLILLPLTDDGIPATASERIAVTEKIFAAASALGYHKEDVCVDGLIMTVSSNQEAAMISLDLIEWCARTWGVNTVCGLSNVSFGMPQRQWVNNAFLGMAIGRGLTMAIANPIDELLMATVASSDVLNGKDRKMAAYVAKFGNAAAMKTIVAATTNADPKSKVANCVLQGDADTIEAALREALAQSIAPGVLVDECLIPAINRVGELFDQKTYFLPQLIMSADAMRKGFEVLEPLLAQNVTARRKEKFILATVKGDIHDIGKNIVALMLRNYGFEVIDLGKDVSAARIIDETVAAGARIVGLSALMTTTMTEMKTVIDLAHCRGLDHLHFIIGGAVVDQDYAASIGAVYAADAMAAVRLAQKLIE